MFKQNQESEKPLFKNQEEVLLNIFKQVELILVKNKVFVFLEKRETLKEIVKVVFDSVDKIFLQIFQRENFNLKYKYKNLMKEYKDIKSLNKSI